MRVHLRMNFICLKWGTPFTFVMVFLAPTSLGASQGNHLHEDIEGFGPIPARIRVVNVFVIFMAQSAAGTTVSKSWARPAHRSVPRPHGRLLCSFGQASLGGQRMWAKDILPRGPQIHNFPHTSGPSGCHLWLPVAFWRSLKAAPRSAPKSPKQSAEDDWKSPVRARGG